MYGLTWKPTNHPAILARGVGDDVLLAYQDGKPWVRKDIRLWGLPMAMGTEATDLYYLTVLDSLRCYAFIPCDASGVPLPPRDDAAPATQPASDPWEMMAHGE